jgi:hypothetical protein
MKVYILINREIYGLSRIIAVYDNLAEAEKHRKNLDDNEDFFDDNNYSIETHSVDTKF